MMKDSVSASAFQPFSLLSMNACEISSHTTWPRAPKTSSTNGTPSYRMSKPRSIPTTPTTATPVELPQKG